MYSFLSGKKRVDFQRYVRRLIDLTSPNRADCENVQRSENRYNRVIPALLCPWEHETPIISKVVRGLTRDVADRGVGLVLNNTCEADEVVLGFCEREATGGDAWFFLGKRRTNVAIGGGFWLIGIELTEFMNDNWAAQLEPLVTHAQTLLPPCPTSNGAAALLNRADDLLDEAVKSS
jgi:hypothetical protein